MNNITKSVVLIATIGAGLSLINVNTTSAQLLQVNKNEPVNQNTIIIAQKTQTQTMNKTEILANHNKYRQELKLPPLKWSDKVAISAQNWANTLAAKRQFQHSQIKGLGENIWMGTAGYFSFTQMVDSWGGEKQYFKYDTFPNVSTTGDWSVVGHYTQIIWKNTTEVGCGFATNGKNDYLVCQYNPPGNYTGQKVY